LSDGDRVANVESEFLVVLGLVVVLDDRHPKNAAVFLLVVGVVEEGGGEAVAEAVVEAVVEAVAMESTTTVSTTIAIKRSTTNNNGIKL
jgi:hypothetical protein